MTSFAAPNPSIRAARRRDGPRATASLWFSLALFALAFEAALLLASQLTLYCDDYFYAVFFRHGWQGFWDLTLWHYRNFNGRAFIHLLAELTLAFGTKLFILLLPAMLSGVFLLGIRVQSPGVSLPQLLCVSAVGVLGTLALPVDFLNSSLLWISAAFNYLFPVCFLLLVFWLQRRDIARRRRFPLTIPLCFLAGATTEQCGLAAIVCLGGCGLLFWLRKKLPLWQGILPVVLTAAGYLTVLYAPGTHKRLEDVSTHPLDFLLEPEIFLERFQLSLHHFTGENGLVWLFPLFCVLIVFHALVTRRSPKALLFSAPPAAAAYLLLHWTGHDILADAVAVAFFLLAALAYLLLPQTMSRGLLLLAMLASQLVLMVSNSSAYRTAIPGILLTLAVCTSLVAECLHPLPQKWAPILAGAGLALLLPLFLPTYQGYAQVQPTAKSNEAALTSKQGSPILLDLDLDTPYRYQMFFDSSYCWEKARDYYGITTEKVSFTGGGQPVSGTYGGQRAGLPAVMEPDGLFFSLQDTLQLCGGDSLWSAPQGGTIAWLGESAYLISPDGQVCPWDQAREQADRSHSFATIPRTIWSSLYVPADLLKECFGITADYNQQENIYYIHREELPS